ncbi:MAG: serine/threonine protein kinase [Myxococcales bacterium]|nr:serine/threonine protein kinase [Myxococcales bacterium]
MTAARDVDDSGSAELRFGNYRVIEKLGEGGMGTVYLARQEGGGLDRLAVVKAVRAKLLDEPEVVERFTQEARVNARLSHPNIVQVYELGDVDGLPYVVMEHVHGRSFDQIIAAARARGETLPLEVILRVCCDLLRALSCAHGYVDELGRPHRVIHRDVKPGNVLVGFDGSVKLIDFGLAKTTTSSLKTSTGIIRGTLAYMAPEQASAQPVDERSDLFAVGCILFELLEGHTPFDRGDVLPTLRAICDDPTPEITASAPDELKEVVKLLLAKRPEDRFASADEALGALSSCGELADDATLRELLVLLYGRAARRLLPTSELERAQRGSDPTVQAGSPSSSRRSASARHQKDRSRDALADTQHATDPSTLRTQAHAPSSAAPATRRLSPALLLLVVLLLGGAGFGAYFMTRRTSADSGSGSASAARTAVVAAGTAPDSGTASASVAASGTASASASASASGTASASDSGPDPGTASASAPAPGTASGTASASAARRRRRAAAARRAAARRAAARKAAAEAKAKAAAAAAAAAAAKKAAAAAAAAKPAAVGTLAIAASGRRHAFAVSAAGGSSTVRGTFTVTLRYRVSGARLVASLSSTPWTIAYVSGTQPGRTPRHGIAVGAASRRVELRHPDGRSMVLQLSYRPGR